jgi:hypothetical protein
MLMQQKLHFHLVHGQVVLQGLSLAMRRIPDCHLRIRLASHGPMNLATVLEALQVNIVLKELTLGKPGKPNITVNTNQLASNRL